METTVIEPDVSTVEVRDTETIVILGPGIQGPAGPPGPPGSGGASFEQSFTTPQSPWVVNHNLGGKPFAVVYDDGFNEVEAHVIHANDNQLYVYFSVPSTGKIRCFR